MPAGYINLTIEQGATFLNEVQLTNPDATFMDLTGLTGSAKIRKSYYWNENVYSLTVTIISPPTDGKFSISATSADTSAMSPGRYFFDLEITGDGTVTRILDGICEVRPNATK